jgi:hypothetical protein
MARKLRIQYGGAVYHVLNRGDRREEIFRDDLDRRRFLETLAEACAKTGWQVQAYCLMPNHFHLVVETPEANLVAGMKWFPMKGSVPAIGQLLIDRPGGLPMLPWLYGTQVENSVCGRGLSRHEPGRPTGGNLPR